MRTIEHKNIILNLFHDKKQVLQMYQTLFDRRKENGKDTTDSQNNIDIVTSQLEMLLEKYPQYLI